MKFIDWLTDNVALAATVLIGIATTFYLFASITPELWSQIVMGVLGGGLPLLSVRFRVKKKVRFFWLTVSLIVFCDVSMLLSLTASQSHGVEAAVQDDGKVPPALARLQKDADDAQATVKELLRQQDQAKTVEFVQILQPQMAAAIASRDAAQRLAREWKPAESSTSARVNSRDVFMAIPDALFSLRLERYITMILGLLVAIVYQGTVIATVAATVKQAKRADSEGAKPKRKRQARKKAEAAPADLPATPAPAGPFDGLEDGEKT